MKKVLEARKIGALNVAQTNCLPLFWREPRVSLFEQRPCRFTIRHIV